MNPSSSATNHPVPENSSADGRDGVDGSAAELTPPPAVVLPPRRSVKDQPDSRPAEGRNVGLRIEAHVKRGSKTKAQRLEVQEIHSTIVRLDQAVQNPPKPPRKEATFQHRPAHHKSKFRGEGSSWGVGNQHPALWVAGSGIAVIAIVISAMILLPSINASNAPRSGIQTKEPAARETKDDVAALRGLISKQPEALEIFHSYIKASHVDEIVPLVRDGAIMTELLRKNWQPSSTPESWTPSVTSNWSVSEQDGQTFGVLQVTMPDGFNFNAYFSHKSDRLQLDWKATTAYGSATFAELVKNQGNPAEIRGEISQSDFYTATWLEKDYQCYRLLSANRETFIWCYARRGSEADESIARYFRKSGITRGANESRKITLQLERGPDGAMPNQWLIGEVLHFDWVTP